MTILLLLLLFVVRSSSFTSSYGHSSMDTENIMCIQTAVYIIIIYSDERKTKTKPKGKKKKKHNNNNKRNEIAQTEAICHDGRRGSTII